MSGFNWLRIVNSDELLRTWHGTCGFQKAIIS
jgi:hypothetical protein